MKFKEKLICCIDEPKAIYGVMRGFSFANCYNFLKAKRIFKKKFNTILDVGSNQGETIEVYNLFGDTEDIHSFEPQKKLHKFLLLAKTKIHPYGLWDETKELELTRFGTDTGAATILKPKELMANGREPVKEIVPLKRFDSLNIKIRRPCFLKIDVEGGEINVLRGFGKRLKEIDIIQLEYSFQDFVEEKTKLHKLIKVLSKYGLDIVHQGFKTIQNGELASCEFYFKRRN